MQNLLVLARKVKTFISMDNKEKFNIMQTFFYIGFYRAFILFVPFNKLRKRMGKHKQESLDKVDNDTYKIARRISARVLFVSAKTPWESKCLVQALTAQKMLKKQGVSTTLYLGVKKDNNNQMLAHAWIRCGDYFVTGGGNRHGYAVVAKFAS